MSVMKGVAIAIVNLVVVALAIGFTEPRHAMHTAMLVCMYGGMPAVFCGVIVGAIAGVHADRDPGWRWVWLAPLPIALVVLLGTSFRTSFGFHHLIIPACVPTLAAVALLERWTRRAPEPPVPVATITT